MEKTKYTTISIPVTLAKKIEERIEGTGFNSVTSYVVYVIRQVISSIESDKSEKPREPFTKKDEEEIKKRLKALGYI